MRDSVCEHGIHGRSGIQSACRRVTHQRPRRRRRRRVYFGPYRNNPDNNGMDQIVTIPLSPYRDPSVCLSDSAAALGAQLSKAVWYGVVNVDLHLKKPMYHYAAEEDRAMAIVNESVPIQLAQCWFRGLAISIFQC